MLNTREKLIEVIRNFNSKIVPYYAEEIADKLIANGVTVQEWISVRDRLPEEGLSVLTLHEYVAEDYGNMVVASFKNGMWRGCFGSTVTHWMPLPQPPKGE